MYLENRILNKINKILLIAFFLQLSANLYSQQYTLKSYNVDINVPGLTVLYGFQDRGGFLWFGTKGGVYKFDGKKFTKFPLAPGSKGNISVHYIMQDSKGNYWFATSDGIQKFDGKSITQYSTFNMKPIKGIKKIIEDDQGFIWFLGHHVIFKMEKNLLVDFTQRIGSADEFFVDIIKEENNSLLFFSYESVKRLTQRGITSAETYKKIPRKQLSAVLIDSRGSIWVGDNRGKLWIYNKALGVKSLFNNAENHIVNLFEDKDGCIWVSTSKGLFKYEGSKLNPVKTAKDDFKQIFLYSFEDKEGNQWACTVDGVIKIMKAELSQNNSFQEIKLKNVKEILEDQKGQLWFGTNYGLFNYINDKLTKYPLPSDPKVNRINSILQSADETIWIATDGGLIKLKDGVRKVYTTKDGLRAENVYSMLEDRHGRLWFRNGMHLGKFDGAKFSFTCKENELNHFVRLFENRNHEVLLGDEIGYKTESGQTVLSFDKLQNIKNNIEGTGCIVKCDNKGAYWIGINDKGFGRISKNGGVDELITAYDGLVDGLILTMMFDSNGYLWIGTQKGLSRFDAENYNKTGKKVFENYKKSESGQTISVLSLYEDKQGNVWVGTKEELLIFSSGGLKKGITPVPPAIYFTKIRLFLDKFDYRSYSKKIDKSGLPIDLTLPYDKNYLSFDFIGLDLTNPDDVEYRYKLSGFDSTWSPIVRYNEVTFTNLPPGKYKFEVIARNKNGVWSEKPATLYFVITPPFWKTWWFYLICFIIGASSIYGYIRVRTNNLEKQKEVLEKTVELRTKELQEEKAKVEEVNRELEKSRYQLAKINDLQAKWLDDLSESEKQLIESNTNKDKLFSLISHDLRSPFRSLLLYSELMLGKIDSLTVKEIKQYTEDVHKYAENIYRLVEDLLEWSRMQIGRMEFEPKSFNISAPVDKTFEMLKGNAEKKNINLVNYVENPIEVYADENMIKSVLNNLISNAIKFTNWNGRVKVTSEKENGHVIVSVSDNGIGMTSEEISKLFRIEKHFHKTGTANEKGTGMGLILCKELIEKNGGSIYVDSTIGKGSTFRFTIPTAKEATNAEKEENIEKAEI